MRLWRRGKCRHLPRKQASFTQHERARGNARRIAQIHLVAEEVIGADVVRDPQERRGHFDLHGVGGNYPPGYIRRDHAVH